MFALDRQTFLSFYWFCKSHMNIWFLSLVGCSIPLGTQTPVWKENSQALFCCSRNDLLLALFSYQPTFNVFEYFSSPHLCNNITFHYHNSKLIYIFVIL